MKHRYGKRPPIAVVVILLTASLAVPVPCAAETFSDGVTPTYDEAYYATLDYYGNLTDGSMVKSYILNGAGSITDYGVYDEVNNLTDGSAPVREGNKWTFQFGENAPNRFYFEGKTAAPYQSLPWTLSMTYSLNGVPTKAEDLAGKTGEVEIDINAVPNPAASEYARNNYTLEIAAMFNADDILSLDAPGAQIQLVGNLRTVLFLAMPGEEEHFQIRVGTDSFTFDGCTFLMVPATLAQLDQIAELRDAKTELEDSFEQINDSLDTLLNALDGMNGSLQTAANGLDELNTARGQISDGKENLYAQADQVLGDFDSLNAALEPVNGTLETSKTAIADIHSSLSDLSSMTGDLKDNLGDIQDSLTALQTDSDNLKSLLTDVEGNLPELRRVSDRLVSDFNNLGNNQVFLNSYLGELGDVVSRLSGVSTVAPISVNGMTIAQLEKQVAALDTAYKNQYLPALEQLGYTTDQLSFAQFLQQFGGYTAETAQNAAQLYAYSQTAEYTEKIKEATSANQIITVVDGKITELNDVLDNLSGPTASVLGELENLSEFLDSDHLFGDLSTAAESLRDTLQDLQDHRGEGVQTLEDLDRVNDTIQEICDTSGEALDRLQAVQNTLNAYEPTAQSALTDAQTINNALRQTLGDTTGFLDSSKTLLQDSDDHLDSGTKNTLTGLADTLRRVADSLDSTGSLRGAKNSIHDLITDQWNEHTGEENNLLLMDPDAAAVSLTSAENPAPQSVQVLIRSQEIKTPQQEEPTEIQTTTKNIGFFGRIAQFFQDLAHGFKE